MAPKRQKAKSVAAKKAAAKPVPKPAHGKLPGPEAPPTAAAAAAETAASTSRRRLRKHNTEEKAKHLIRSRLTEVLSAEHVSGLRDSEGRSIQEFVVQEIRHLKKHNKHWCAKSWDKVFSNFDLKRSAADRLADPPDGEAPGDEFTMTLAFAHAENPAVRKVGPLVKFLEDCEPLNKAETFGLLNAIQECAVVTCTNSQAMHIATLKYIARTEARKTFPDYWETMSSQFDLCMARDYGNMSGKHGVSAVHYARANLDVLSLFMPRDAVSHVVDAMASKLDPDPSSVLGCVRASTVGDALFANLTKRMRFLNFVDTIEKQLLSLENLDFEDSEVKSFETLMGRMARDVTDDSDGSPFEMRTAKVGFLDVRVDATTTGATDEWKIRLSAKVKTLALNHGDIPPMPWESLIYGIGEILGARSTVNVPARLYGGVKNAREACLAMLVGTTLLSEWKRIVSANLKALVALEKMFSLDYAFLLEHAERMATEKIHQQILGLLPASDRTQVPSKVLAALQDIRRSNLCLALGSTVDGEVDAICSMVGKIAGKTGLADVRVARFSKFFQTCVSRLVNFCSVSTSAPNEHDANHVKTLIGMEAVQFKYNEAQKLYDAPGSPMALRDVMELRTFNWVLTDEQKSTVSEWISVILKPGKDRQHQALCDKTSAQASPSQVLGESRAGGSQSSTWKPSSGLALAVANPGGGAPSGKRRKTATGEPASSSSSAAAAPGGGIAPQATLAKFFAPRGPRAAS